jgi:hypothetical protein
LQRTKLQELKIAIERVFGQMPVQLKKQQYDAYLADYKSKPKRVIWAIASCLLAAGILYSILIFFGILNNEIPCEEKTRDNLNKLIKHAFSK